MRFVRTVRSLLLQSLLRSMIPHKTHTGCVQLIPYGRGAPLPFCERRSTPFSASDGKLSTVDRVKSVPAVRSCCLDPKPFGNDFCKSCRRRRPSRDLHRPLPAVFFIADIQSTSWSMSACADIPSRFSYMCRYPDILSEQIHIPRAVQKAACREYPPPDNPQRGPYTPVSINYALSGDGYAPPHIPEAEMMTLGVGSALIVLESSLVTVRCKPSNPTGFIPLSRSSFVSSSK